MSFPLFLLLTAVLFVRPAEVVPELLGLPIYNGLILACLASAPARVLGQLAPGSLLAGPVSACVVGVLAGVVLSHACRFDLTNATGWGVEFAKVVLFYLLTVAVLDTPARLRRYLTFLTVCVAALAGLALLQYHGAINVPALAALERVEYDEEGGAVSFTQLRSTGVFNDPNDLCLILVVGVVLALYGLFETRGLLRAVWAAPLAVFLYALVLTRSRGGFLALLAGLLWLLVGRLGFKKAVPLAVLAVPGLFLMSGGRQTQLSVGQGTAQERIEKWREGLAMFARSPLTGIGVGRYADEVGLVAHNSFVHAYTEMGLVGGDAFLGLFLTGLLALGRAGGGAPPGGAGGLSRLRPYLSAVIVGYGTGLLSLSRCYIIPTYMIFGLASAYIRVSADPASPPPLRLDLRHGARVFAAGLGFLVAAKLFVAASLG